MKETKETKKPRKRAKRRAPIKGKKGELDYFTYSDKHQKVIRAFTLFLEENKGQFPTPKELAQSSGVQVRTVKAVIARMNLSNFVPNMRLLTPQVLLGLAGKAASGDAASAKLWFQVVEGWSETHKLKGEGEGGALKIEVTRRIIRSNLDK